MSVPGIRSSISIAAVTLTTLMLPQMARAKTFRCADQDVKCLIFSIEQANANGSPKNTIQLEGTAYVIGDAYDDNDGPNGLPSVTSTLTVVGLQGTAMIARAPDAPAFRLFHVGGDGHLTLKAVSITNGHITNANGGGLLNYGETTIAHSTFTGNHGLSGGAIANEGGTVTVTDSTITDNEAASRGAGLFNNAGVVTVKRTTFTRNGPFGDGGGVYNANGQLTITDCSFVQNSAVGGGALVSRFGTVRIVGSRILANEAQLDTGGVLLTGGTASIDRTTFENNKAEGPVAIGVRDGSLVVTNSAFVGNLGSRFFVAAGAIDNRAGSVQVTNTTFTGNGSVAVENSGRLTLTNTTFAENVNNIVGGIPVTKTIVSSGDAAITILENTIVVHSPDQTHLGDCGGRITSLGNNIIGDVTGCDVSLQPGDRTGDAGLGALEDEGIVGQAHYPLLPSSQAINTGNDSVCPRRDQIGNVRRRGCDIGAVEFTAGKP